MSVGKPLACAAALISISLEKVRKITTFFPLLQIFLGNSSFFFANNLHIPQKSRIFANDFVIIST